MQRTDIKFKRIDFRNKKIRRFLKYKILNLFKNKRIHFF